MWGSHWENLNKSAWGALNFWKLQNSVTRLWFFRQHHCWYSRGRKCSCHVITGVEIDRKRETAGVSFWWLKGFIEGMDDWASAGINLLLILTANTFASVYPTLGFRVFKLSARGNGWSVKAMWSYLLKSDSAQVMGNSSCMVFQEKVLPSIHCHSCEIKPNAGFSSFLAHKYLQGLVKLKCNGRC